MKENLEILAKIGMKVVKNVKRELLFHTLDRL